MERASKDENALRLGYFEALYSIREPNEESRDISSTTTIYIFSIIGELEKSC